MSKMFKVIALALSLVVGFSFVGTASADASFTKSGTKYDIPVYGKLKPYLGKRVKLTPTKPVIGIPKPEPIVVADTGETFQNAVLSNKKAVLSEEKPGLRKARLVPTKRVIGIPRPEPIKYFK